MHKVGGAGGEATHREGTGRARGLRAKRRRPGAAWYHRALPWPCARSFVALGSQGRSPGPLALEVRATKRPTIPAPSHLLDKVVKRHYSSTNVVTLELSNLFVVNEHTDGANTALMNHKISSLTILTLVRAKRHRPRKEHSDSYASSMS